MSAGQDPYTAVNNDDPNVKQKVDGLLGVIKSVGTAMLTTRAPDSEELHSRAMYPSSIDHLKFTFFGNVESGKFDGIEKDKHVNISYYNSDNTSWVSIAGVANISNDRERIKELYSPHLKAWFGDLGDGKHTGEADDPRIELIEVTPKEIRYFVEQKNIVTKSIDIVTSAVTGSVAQPGKLVVLNGHELETAKKIVGATVKV
ncbi:Pyridoxamine 5'-phosphate oxidase-like, FMN-binding domain [Phaffia rhodozyma]|uniref:Pyridoxamine 5'-phosphate oxidase-like, FMN-binding domain n=1 Tax=Phaffia rhodozyma TaxID=264483 RepID=A0A0F7SP22_PHARH|nr:Pyridoxamine 5'-phosphate oxidase-like, FMN-binding domain [Phaffia rhodozyma]